MSKANEKAVKKFFDEHRHGEVVNHAAVVALLDEAGRRALLNLARWASKTATAAERAPVEWYRADEHYAKVDSMRAIASECRRRAKKGKR